MGILDGYQFDPQTYGGSGGILAQLAQQFGLPNQNQVQQGFPDTGQPDPRYAQGVDMLRGLMGGGQGQLPQNSAPTAGGGQGVTLPQMGSEGLGRDQGAQSPLSGLLSGISGLFSGGPSAAYASAAPGAGQQQGGPPPSAAAGPGFLDRLSAGANSLEGGNPIAALFNAVGGLATGQRNDVRGQALQQQESTYRALVQSGVPPGVAQAAAVNPEVLKTIAPQLYTKPELKMVKGLAGEDTPMIWDASKQTLSSPGVGGVAGPSSPTGGLQVLAPGVAKYNPQLTGEDYMNQFGPEVKAAAKLWLEGGQMPTGNPRLQGILPFAKTVATKYAADMGIPFSDSIYNARRNMATELTKSSNSSMGGIISNGLSAFEHLANYSDKLVPLKNYNGPSIWGGATIGELGNKITNTTPEANAKVSAAAQNALKYGQESTKFYAGTGGGEAERMHALKSTSPGVTTSFAQAGFLETEKQLMLGRLREKEAQIRSTYGDHIPAEAQRTLHDMTEGLKPKLDRIDANIAKLRGQEAPASGDTSPTHAQPAPLPPPDAQGWISLPNGLRIREKK